jgi:hypothetical protein
MARPFLHSRDEVFSARSSVAVATGIGRELRAPGADPHQEASQTLGAHGGEGGLEAGYGGPERDALNHVIERLRLYFPKLRVEEIERSVFRICCGFPDGRIRNFVPILVERLAGNDLNGL